MTARPSKPWRPFLAAWLGWAFDGLDGYLYVLVAVPLVAQLLGKPPSDPEVAGKAAIIQAFFLFGWSAGGALFGRLGDRLGRARTLTLTILVYAMFTGLSFFATAWWHLLIFRFIAALGIGGEWAAGSALVGETLHPRHRAWASALLQSGYMVGMMLAAATIELFKALSASSVGQFGHFQDPRWVFVVGVLPALATVWIRRSVPEPAEWKAAAERERLPSASRLLGPPLRRTTLLTLGMTAATLTTVWAFLYFGPQAVRAMAEVREWPKARVDSLVTRLTLLYTAVNIVGNFAATYLARAVGYRKALIVMLIGACASTLIGFAHPLTLANVGWVMSAVAFFALGLFGLYPLYIPALFPTLLRTLGAGLCYNTGRLVAGFAVIYGGVISARADGPGGAIWWAGLVYLPTILLAAFMPEVREAEEGERGR